MINLRDYQQKAVDAIRRAYAHKKRAPLLVLPTGGGKTTIFAYVTQQASLKIIVCFYYVTELNWSNK